MINFYLNMISQTEIRRSNTSSFSPGDQNVWAKRNFPVGKTCGRNLPLTQENKIFVSSEVNRTLIPIDVRFLLPSITRGLGPLVV